LKLAAFKTSKNDFKLRGKLILIYKKTFVVYIASTLKLKIILKYQEPKYLKVLN
jgi:hypothetical protein